MSAEEEVIVTEEVEPVIEEVKEPEVVAEEPTEGEEDPSVAEGEEKKKNPIPKWMAKRIGGLTDERDNARLQAEETAKQNKILLEQMAALKRGETVEDAPAKGSENLTKAQINQAAEELVARQKTAENIKNIIAEGNKEFADFDESTSVLADALGDSFRAAADLLIEIPEAHKIIQHLGNDPEEAIRIFSLSPVKQVMELTKLSDKITTPKDKKITKAPDPIKPVTGRAASAPTLESAKTTAEFVAIRNKQLRDQGKKHLL